VTEVWRRALDAEGSTEKATKSPRPELPTKPSKPTKRPRKPEKPTKPTKPVKPAKKPTAPPPIPNEITRENSLRDHTRNGVPAEAHRLGKSLHRSAEQAIAAADLFIPNYLDFAYQLAARSRARGIASRCIGICHCDQENYYNLLTHYAPIIHSFIAVSPRCMKQLITLLPSRVDDIHLVPYGVATPRFQSATREHGPLRLLYAGRLVRKQKRIFDLVEIVRELDRRGTDYSLSIVGVGPDRDQLTAELNCAPRVCFYPGVCHTEIAGVYQDHDVFLLPSETEGTSIALLESMAHGLVPVATRVSGSEDVIIDGCNGILCDVGDVRRMAEGIEALAGNESKRREMAALARETVARGYQMETQLSAFETCLQQTLNKPLVTVEAARFVLRQSPIGFGRN
jgi:glycosyltransferase involved in cell wall biosynthesis